MTPENFCYWLQGLFEIEEPDFLSKGQIRMIRDHLSLVFNHPKAQAEARLRAFDKIFPKSKTKWKPVKRKTTHQRKPEIVRYCASK